MCMRKKRAWAPAAALALSLAALACGCGGGGARTALVLATAPYPYETGLLDRWVSMFEAEYPYDVEVRASDSSRAIQTARDGECDVTLTSDPAGELWVSNFVLTVNKRDVMHVPLIIAGPPSDPAGIRGSKDAVEAFRRISEAQSRFASCGDGSDLNLAERGVWETVTGEPEPDGPWYLRSGRGAGDTLLFAGEQGAYVLTDTDTFLAFGEQSGLERLLEGGNDLVMRYVVMEVNPAAFPDVNAAGARAFAEFVTGPEAQSLLEGFGVEERGERLFRPDAL